MSTKTDGKEQREARVFTRRNPGEGKGLRFPVERDPLAQRKEGVKLNKEAILLR